MSKSMIRKLGIVTIASLILISSNVTAQPDHIVKKDFGKYVEHLLKSHSRSLFGVKRLLSAPADVSDYVPREQATASQRVKLAKGLQAKFVARNISFKGDMIAFWPNNINYSHLIICIEEGRKGTTPVGNAGVNSSVQWVNAKTGKVETILHGMDRCDGNSKTKY